MNTPLESLPTSPQVLNKHKGQSLPNSVYIGRPSKWGNPFIMGRDGTRSEVISKYQNWLTPEFIRSIKKELRGKNLVCFCVPLACHGDVLLEIANSP